MRLIAKGSKQFVTLFEVGVTVISVQSFATVEKLLLAILSRQQSAGLRDTRWISGPKLSIAWHTDCTSAIYFCESQVILLCKIASVSFDWLSTTKDIFVKFGVKSALRSLQWSTAITQNFHKPTEYHTSENVYSTQSFILYVMPLIRGGLAPMQLHWAPHRGVWVDYSFLSGTPCAWEFSRNDI